MIVEPVRLNWWTLASIGIVAWVGSDLTHEVLGNMTAAWLTGNQTLSLSVVAMQTATESRVVACCRTLAIDS